MRNKNIWSLWGGGLLILLGLLYLIGQFLPGRISNYLWPFFIIGAGSLFFAGMFSGGKATGALAIPGSILMMIGLIFLVQAVFNLWSTWAYAWALLAVAAGIGLTIFGLWSDIPELRGVGRVVITAGLGVFFVFGFIFEVIFNVSGLGSVSGILWPVLLILVGVYLLVGRRLSFGAGSFRPAGEGEFAGDALFAAPPGSDLPLNAAGGVIRRLTMRAVGDMLIVQGEEEALLVDASREIKARVRSAVRDGTLHIWIENDWWDWMNFGMWNNVSIRYQLKVRSLEGLHLAGVGSIRMEHLQTPRLEIDNSGAGSISLHDLQTEVLRVGLSGVGSIEVAGRATQQDVRLSGTGSYSAGRLNSGSATAHLSGLGSAVLWVTDHLDAALSGLGSIEYYGAPQLTQRVSGLGSVRSLGQR